MDPVTAYKAYQAARAVRRAVPWKGAAAMFGSVALFGGVVCGSAVFMFTGRQEPTDPAGCGTTPAVVPVAATSVGDLDAEQTANAAVIVQTGTSLGVPARGLVVAVATALQESGLHNIDYGDRDSVGLFQQRDAWGPLTARMDPATSARMFYTGGQGGQRGLLDIPDWEQLPITVAAQRVQVSAFPTAYAKWETTATNTVQALLGGNLPAAATCPPAARQGTGTTPDVLKATYQNGRIPADELCPPTFAPNHRFQCDAAAALDQLDTAYKATFGADMCITDSYRDLAGQIDVRARKGRMAAVPGTSNHGWGLAADLCGGINRFGTPQHEWMRANAGRYGWTHPAWAQQGGSKPEPWHWEYVGTATTG